LVARYLSFTTGAFGSRSDHRRGGFDRPSLTGHYLPVTGLKYVAES
jgi:hypothetical protein